MPFCPLSPTLPASQSANKSPRICYECSLSPSCRANARGVLLREKLGRAHPRFLTAKSLRNPRPRRREKNVLSDICRKGAGKAAELLSRARAILESAGPDDPRFAPTLTFLARAASAG